MRTQFTSTVWRITIYLLLFTLVIAPVAGSVRAAPNIQEADPNGVTAPGDHLVTDIVLSPRYTQHPAGSTITSTSTLIYSTTEAGRRADLRPSVHQRRAIP